MNSNNSRKHRLGDLIKRLLKSPANRGRTTTVRRRVDQWSIGIYTSDRPFNFVSIGGCSNPVLTYRDVSDIPARFVADPFMIEVDHNWYMFFEVMNSSTRKGEIGLAVSANGIAWSYQKIVLAAPFHLSYPYVFEWMGDYYMIPESRKARSVRLYRAANFPSNWSYVRTILSIGTLADSSIFRLEGKWWLFSEANSEEKSDTLRLYFADDLMDTWHEHPKSPLIAGNPHIARPGGRVVVYNGRVIRYTQDCFPRYGNQLRAFEITELSTRHYKEKEAPEKPILVYGDGDGWNTDGMHHIDPHQISSNEWIACVDGNKRVWKSDSRIVPGGGRQNTGFFSVRPMFRHFEI